MTTLADHPARLGLVVPGDCHVDDELWALATPEAFPYVTRTRGAADDEMGRDGIAETTGLAEGPEIGMAADRLLDVAPVAAAYVDTSISFVRGAAGDAEITARLESRLGCPSVTTSTAVAEALAMLGARRLAVLSVYTEAVDARLRDFYSAHDIETVQVVRLARSYPSGATSRELGATRPEVLVAEAANIGAAAIDALFIPCTALRTLRAIDPIEQALGVPVVTAIQATMWSVLRRAGLRVTRSGAGRLFRHAAPVTAGAR
jgi:maleate isomerase